MQLQQIQIRSLTDRDIDRMMSLVDWLGWNQIREDLQFFLNRPGAINLAATCDGLVAGTVTSINYQSEVAWIGMMIVDGPFQGKGIGRYLLRSLIALLLEGGVRQIRLDATPAGRPLYEKLNFRVDATIFRLVNERFDPAGLVSCPATDIRPMKADDLEDVARMDREIFGACRQTLLAALRQRCPGKACVLKHNGELLGFACGRSGRRFHHLGPVWGKSESAVRLLLIKSLSELKGQAVVVDVFSERRELLVWLESLGFQRRRPLYRMTLQGADNPTVSPPGYLICGPEFG